MIASAVDSRKTGFFAFARRRNTELRLPAISRDGSSPSNGRLFSLGTPERRTIGRVNEQCWPAVPPCSPLRQGIRCRHGCSSSIAGGDEGPPCRAAKKRRSQNAEDCQSSSTRERRGLSWLSSQIYNLIPGATGTTTTGPLLQHLAKFGRGFARTQKQRHKQALIDSPRFKAKFPAHAGEFFAEAQIGCLGRERLWARPPDRALAFGARAFEGNLGPCG